jgi:ABC-type nickel/cobalt efflux system permease component RcnA
MRPLVLTLALALALALAIAAAAGWLDGLAAWAAALQREAQTAMAGALRRLRAGEPGALALLLGICFAYGVAHAAGPGHGKVLIGGYGVGSRVRLTRLAAIALAASLAQATAAVVLVYAGVLAFGWTREHMTGLAEGALQTASTVAIWLIGLWLVLRGLRGLAARPAPAVSLPVPVPAGGAHHHHPGDHRVHRDHHLHAGHVGCADCGHRHGPTAAEVEALAGWRDAAALVAGIAIRPCTGALFLLILTWRMGIDAAGIAGAYAMGLGVATVTVAVAALAVLSRDGALLSAARLGGARRLVPVLELAAGALVALVALNLLARGA